MTTEQIASRLAELCRQGQFEAAQKELYAENAVSIEPEAMPDFPKETRGLRAIIEKGHKFESMVEKVQGTRARQARGDLRLRSQRRQDSVGAIFHVV
jgi:SnoaL-like domain